MTAGAMKFSELEKEYRGFLIVAGLFLISVLAAVLISDWAADRGLFGYHNNPSNEQNRATAQYCDAETRRFVEYVSRLRDATQHDPYPNKAEYDSCQQWKAADVAERAAYWTQWQGVAALTSIPILVLAFYAAWKAAGYTREAAHWTRSAASSARTQAAAADMSNYHTARSADAARDAAQAARDTLIASNRAWLQISEMICDGVNFGNGNAIALLVYRIENAGSAPAHAVAFKAELASAPVGALPIEELMRVCESSITDDYNGEHGFIVFPRETTPPYGSRGEFAHAWMGRDALEKAVDDSGMDKSLRIFVVGCLNYMFHADPNRVHQTQFIFQLRSSVDDTREFRPEREKYAFSEVDVDSAFNNGTYRAT